MKTKPLILCNKNQLRAGTHDERFNNIENYRTARLHFEP